MRKTKVKLDFVRLSTPELIAFAGSMVMNINKSPYFPNPDVPLDELTKAEKLPDEKYISTRNGGKVEMSAMRNARKALTDLLYR